MKMKKMKKIGMMMKKKRGDSMTTNENRIRELENELAELKRETELTKRLEHIAKKVEEREQKTNDELDDLRGKYSELYCEISAMENDIVNIITIARAMDENRFSYRNSIDGVKVESNGLRWGTSAPKDRITASDDNSYATCILNDDLEMEIRTRLSYDKGECDKRGVSLPKESEIWSLKQSINGMKLFVRQFPIFRDKFYEYIDNL